MLWRVVLFGILLGGVEATVSPLVALYRAAFSPSNRLGSGLGLAGAWLELTAVWGAG